MNGDVHVRFWESAGVQFPRATHLPLYRLEHVFARSGLEIDRSTMCVWAGDVADLVKPLYDLMVKRVLASHVVHTDDTVMPMLQPGKTRQARMWVYAGDEAGGPYNVFDFTVSRSRDGPATFLKNFREVLQADAYGGYDGICVEKSITQAGCWAHARRKFVDCQTLEPTITGAALAWIGQLFAVEEQARDLSPADRLSRRQQHSLPVLGALYDQLLAWRAKLLPKHPVAQAIGYVLNQWQPLNVFTTDGAVALDNNLAEREMKRQALNRKNSLFVGKERGGRTAAILSSFTSTCRRHDLDPQLISRSY
jgi:transposase